ncbi:branched-chain amino acid ABC transporter permease [Amorphus orientalis]|uniref:Branched-chain amino acid transport system permease protein n=1 Tax=Amorphus orientalis TaxID=649198 RepID=A0AAE3VLT0_9HYPH|nr:branched-chain amino acid ABC transporter permease [Amorphus orientalis]MDQ0314401.1 branched-chain amino acid transport system permease protein [Amorphus orientalis]
MTNLFFSIAFDGIAYGMLLFTITIGLSITMGVMNFVNLAHGAFAMGGGYLLVTLSNDLGIPFPLSLALIALTFLVIGAFLEIVLFRRFYGASPLLQVLLTIGIVFISISAATYAFGPLSAAIDTPAYLQGRFTLGDMSFPIYRTMVIGFGLGLALVLWFVLDRTLIGAKVRAAVSNRAMAENIGINVPVLFSVLFGVGAALAAVGGALSIEIFGLSPTYALDYLVLVLLVVIVGGMGSIRGAFAASLLIGVIDNAGKFLLPHSGAFLIYLVAFAVLFWRPSGLFSTVEH